MKKTTLSIAIASLVMSPFSALAGSPTADLANAGTHGANLGTNANTTAQQVLKTLKDYGLDQVAYMLAQKLGQKMASASINKTTGGASSDKDPNYVKDFATIMSTIAEEEKDLWTTKLLTSNNPFAKEISEAMLSLPEGDYLPKFTLDSVLGNSANWQDVGKDLSLAGEKGLYFYSQLGLPQNSALGSSMIAENELYKAITSKQLSEQLKLTSGGFRPDTKCNAKIADYKNSVQTIVNNANQINQNNANINNNNEIIEANESVTSAPADEQSDDPLDQAYEQAAIRNSANATNNNAVLGEQNSNLYMNTGAVSADLAMDTAGCIEEMIKNPVATTQTLTNEAGKFGMDMTKNIQGWGQIVAGLFVSLFNGFVNQGLSSLKADYGSVKKATNVGGPEQLTVRDASGNIQPQSNFANSPTSIVDLRADFETSLAKTQKNLDVMNKTRDELLKVPGKLATLDLCLPGPDYIGLPTRMNKYYDQQSGILMKRSIMGDDDKRNGYQTQVMSMLERDYDIAKTETLRDMNDDTKNIPGAGVMRTMINTFQTKKNSLQTMNDAIIKANESLTRLRDINTQLKSSVSFLSQLTDQNGTNIGFGQIPGLVFTKQEWDVLPIGQKDAIYNWLLANSGIAPRDDTGLSADDNRRIYAISMSWGVWEYPYRFLPDKKWPDEVDGVSAAENLFLEKKNEIRSIFGAIKDIIPPEWEISKNEQLFVAYKNDNDETDRLIHDCDMIRILSVGDGGTNTSSAETAKKKWAGNRQAFLADLIANKDTYFKSEAMRNSLTLPNIVTVERTWEQDGCIPNAEFNALKQAQYPTGENFADHGGPGFEYTCMGDFGYLYGVFPSEGGDFNQWIDRTSNAYQVQTHIGGIDNFYGWKWPVRRFTVDPSSFGTGWTITLVKETDNTTNWPDGGKVRPAMCRLSSVLRIYGKFSFKDGDHEGTNFYCSSKWTDVTLSEAIGLFIVNSLN